jgi:hypothetical protein
MSIKRTTRYIFKGAIPGAIGGAFLGAAMTINEVLKGDLSGIFYGALSIAACGAFMGFLYIQLLQIDEEKAKKNHD